MSAYSFLDSPAITDSVHVSKILSPSIFIMKPLISSKLKEETLQSFEASYTASVRGESCICK